jgi:chemotaxis protein CheX
MKPIAAILTLPGVLDLRAAAPLKAQLQGHAAAPVELDAANVERVGGLCAQVLIAAAAAWRGADLSFRILNASQAFREDLARMGANDLVFGSEGSC